MKLFHWFAAAVLVGALSLLLVNCSNGPSCDASSCKTGCCTTNGLCQSGNTPNACGSGGKACSLCSGSQVCTSGVCQNSSCTSNCGGNDSGNPDSGNPTDGGGNNGQFAGYCNTSTVPCTGGLQCAAGLAGGAGGICTANCADGGSCPQGTCVNVGSSLCAETCTGASCGAGDICATFQGGNSICIPDCRLHSDLCGGGLVCDQVAGICTTPGTQMFGQPCGAAGNCDTAAGLECVLLVQGGPTFCTARCTTTPDSCATMSPAGTCDLINPADGGGLCGFPCTGADGGMSGTCPTGLTCQAAFGVFFCQ
jgi:hypothetical protein